MIRACGASLALLLLLGPGRVLAQGATAEELYRQGVAEFEKGNYEAACQAFADSYRAEPLPGALFTLATCEMRAGRLASAAARYQEFLEVVAALPQQQQAVQQERRVVAESERKALLNKLPYLRIVATDQLRSSAEIRLDGVALDETRLSGEVPVDPGEHVIEVRSRDGTSNQVRVTLAEREHKSVVLSPVGPAQLRVETDTPARASDQPRSGPGSTPVAAYVALGVGLVGVGLGSVAGVRALDHKSIVNDECDGPACTSRGKEEADAGKTAALVSTIGFGVGAAGLGTALVLYLTRDGGAGARGQGKSRLVVGLTPRSVELSGAF